MEVITEYHSHPGGFLEGDAVSQLQLIRHRYDSAPPVPLERCLVLPAAENQRAQQRPHNPLVHRDPDPFPALLLSRQRPILCFPSVTHLPIERQLIDAGPVGSPGVQQHLQGVMGSLWRLVLHR